LRGLCENRHRRYTFRWLAREVFMAEGRRLGLKYPANFHRTAACGLYLVSGHVHLRKHIQDGRGFYKGLFNCGRVWSCPVCAAKIQERRRIEISTAISWAHDTGRKCVMVTFTFPHLSTDDLQDLLSKQASAFRALRSGKEWDRYKRSIGFVGMIRSLEITVGLNGYHPHTHELWIVEKSCDADELRRVVVGRWKNACSAHGLLPGEKVGAFLRRSVDVMDNATNSDYFVKWGADRELAKGGAKSSDGGIQPFELLCEFTEKLPLTKEKRAQMWLDYTKAMHGKRQVHWSRGLKDIVGVDDRTDEAVCEESVESSLLVYEICLEHWRLVYRKTAQAELLYRAETGGRESVEEWFILQHAGGVRRVGDTSPVRRTPPPGVMV